MKDNVIKKIYEIAHSFDMAVYPYIKKRIDNSEKDHLMKIEELKKLTKEEFKEYWAALYNIHNENALNWDGWVKAQETFKKFGARETKETVGHRIYASVSFIKKPEEVFDKMMKNPIEKLDNLIQTIKN